MKKSILRKIIKEVIEEQLSKRSPRKGFRPQPKRGDGGGKLKTPKKGMGINSTTNLIPGCVEPDSSFNYDGSNPYVPMGEPTFNPDATADCIGNPLPAVVLNALATGDMQTVNYGNLMNLGVDMSCCIYLTGTDD